MGLADETKIGSFSHSQVLENPWLSFVVSFGPSPTYRGELEISFRGDVTTRISGWASLKKYEKVMNFKGKWLQTWHFFLIWWIVVVHPHCLCFGVSFFLRGKREGRFFLGGANAKTLKKRENTKVIHQILGFMWFDSCVWIWSKVIQVFSICYLKAPRIREAFFLALIHPVSLVEVAQHLRATIRITPCLGLWCLHVIWLKSDSKQEIS